MPEGLGTSLDPLSDEYCACEEAGLAEAAGLAFVLPAGGLGERLGFDGVKLALPSEIASGASVLAVYAGHILALQRLVAARLGRAVRMPFVIMTSQDTHAGTAELFAEHRHFGLEPSQVTLLLQQRVAALVDDDARFAAAGKYELLTKPHGHGDVHVLLHRALVRRAGMMIVHAAAQPHGPTTSRRSLDERQTKYRRSGHRSVGRGWRGGAGGARGEGVGWRRTSVNSSIHLSGQRKPGMPSPCLSRCGMKKPPKKKPLPSDVFLNKSMASSQSSAALVSCGGTAAEAGAGGSLAQP